MRVFVAGATGAVGRELVPQLISAGHTVAGLTRSSAKAEAIKRAADHRGCVRCASDPAGVHVVEPGDLPLLIGDDGESDLAVADLLDVLDPLVVGVERVGGEADQLGLALRELAPEVGEGTQLGGTDRGEVCSAKATRN